MFQSLDRKYGPLHCYSRTALYHYQYVTPKSDSNSLNCRVFLPIKLTLRSGFYRSIDCLVFITDPVMLTVTSTVFIKLGCWVWCRLIKNSSVQALAQDAMTDVVFNIFSSTLSLSFLQGMCYHRMSTTGILFCVVHPLPCCLDYVQWRG